MSAVAYKTKKSNPLAAFAAQAKTVTSTKKAQHPTIDKPELEERAKSFVTNKTRSDSYADQAKMDAEELKRVASEAFLDYCQKTGKMESCIHVQAGNVKLSYIVANKYSPIIAHELDAAGNKVESAMIGKMRETFGEDFDRYFSEKTTVELNAEADPADLQEALERLGDLSAKVFKSSSTFQVTDALHQALLCDPVARAKAEPFVSLLVIKPTSPSIRLA